MTTGPPANDKPAGHWRASWPGLVLLLALASPTTAAVITVDGYDSSTSEDGICSLREAVSAANLDLPTGGCPAGSGADTLVLTGNVTLTQEDSFQTGTPGVSSPITIRGNGYAIERSDATGTPSFRIFRVAPTGRLVLLETTVRGGGGSPFPFNGGGILNEGALTVTDGSILSNRGGQGGGIYSAIGSTLRVERTTVHGNGSSQGGGGIANLGTARVSDSTIRQNLASKLWWGGGIENQGDLRVTRSTIRWNSAGNGGGIFNTDSSNNGKLQLVNSTISYNFASPYDLFGTARGGGLYAASGPVTVVHSTFWGNSATGGPSQGGAVYSLGNATFYGTLFADSTGGNCAGSFVDGGNNRADDASCTGIPQTPSGLDPTLGDNGGPTMTHALLATSGAIDTGGSCGLLTDQRGALRSASCDVGAYERGGDDPYEISGSDSSDDSCFGHTIELGRAERHLHEADSSDWVSFQPLEGSEYEIETSDLIGSSDTVLELWSGCTPPMLALDDDGGLGLASNIVYTARANDELEGLNILVRDFNGQAVGRGYDLTLSCVSGCTTCPLHGGDDFLLRNETIVTYRRIEACNTIAASEAAVASGARVVLGAGSSIRLGEGFSVHSDGELVIEVDPDLR